ncbi:hypothetical protein BDY21DRAFT_352613 [Lineolata rhizophorae]|uniref:Very long-chain fatty acid transport protein n=1 Tax=Lineolata rhizophorae TaxID=578093 RepID=A0A6A6NSG3_9PEZI|nr:hypothetical protein BDY21DRAFT_352613 [Lineolata rhizophorae]
MALATAAAAVAGTTAAAAYIDAKFHLRKDYGTISAFKTAQKEWAAAEKSGQASLWYKFEAQAERLADTNEECVWSRQGCYSWRETYAQCCRYAQFFHELGIQPGELMAFYLQNSPEFVFSLLGSWGAGSAPALINFHLAGDALIHCLSVSGAKVIVVDDDAVCRARIEESRARIENELSMRIVFLDQATKNSINAMEPTRPGDELRAPITGDFPFCLLYTSGSTGMPKACPFPMGRAWALGMFRIGGIGLKPHPDGDRFYDCMPLYHGTGCTVLVSCMITGLTICIGNRFSTSRFWDDIRASKATAFVYVGETARYLLSNPKSEKDKDHNVKVMFGNGLRPDVWLKFQHRFDIPYVSEFFNSTEGMFSLANVCGGPYLATAVGHHGALQRYMNRNTIVPVEIDHETNDIVRDPRTGWAIRKPYEEGGEILVACPSEKAFVGYWRNPEATSKRFVKNVFKKGDMWYRTGDALRRTSDGRWYFMDRLGDTFRWKSENVSTSEVATVFGNFPGIVEANVYGVEVPGHDGRAGCAAIYIPPENREIFDFAGLLQHAEAKLPRYAVPIFLRLLAELQPLHNNKPMNKGPLRKEGIDPDLVDKDKPEGKPRDVIMWWPSALGHPTVDVDKEKWIEFTRDDWNSLKNAQAKL